VQSDQLALGIDAGGTETRWALLRQPGELVAEGQVRGFSATELLGEGEAAVASILEELAEAVLAVGQPLQVHAGLTGLGAFNERLAQLIATPLGLPIQAVGMGSDIETAYRDVFTPGQGYLIYAGTGSIAAFIDAEGTLHRAGGRGVLLDDGGGGYWIAQEALRLVWRAEDERPGAWRDSPLAQELFAQMGGSDWALTRQFVYGGKRGDVGRLALAVARAADQDPVARELFRQAGEELARLGLALLQRFGPRPMALAGRAASLHPLLAESLAAALPPGTPFTLRTAQGHLAAAYLALTALTGSPCPASKERP
jgi:N-acetylglucosamine kinase-like BadF-type ATPase